MHGDAETVRLTDSLHAIASFPLLHSRAASSPQVLRLATLVHMIKGVLNWSTVRSRQWSARADGCVVRYPSENCRTQRRGQRSQARPHMENSVASAHAGCAKYGTARNLGLLGGASLPSACGELNFLFPPKDPCVTHGGLIRSPTWRNPWSRLAWWLSTCPCAGCRGSAALVG
jgi:hypothetical protein